MFAGATTVAHLFVYFVAAARKLLQIQCIMRATLRLNLVGNVRQVRPCLQGALCNETRSL